MLSLSVFPFASWTMCITSWSSSSLSVLQSTNRLRRWKSEAAVPSSATGRASKAPLPTSPCAAVILTTGHCWWAFGRTQRLSGRSPFLMQRRKRSSEWSNVKIIMQIIKWNSPNPSSGIGSNQRHENTKSMSATRPPEWSFFSLKLIFIIPTAVLLSHAFYSSCFLWSQK